MKIHCPNCQAQISAENINIQTMTAVCDQCDTVFEFEVPREKSKRLRKVNRPEELQLFENGDKLQMRFRTNWRLDKDETFLASLIVSIATAFLSMITIGGYISDDIPFFLPVIFLSVLAANLYRLATITYNHTEIDMGHDRIKVSRAPLPSPFDAKRSVSLMDVERIRCEETKKSKKEDYDTPRYRVWAETDTGKEKLIITDVIEDYAYFITQTLDEHLVTYRLHDGVDSDDDYALLSDDDLFLHGSGQAHKEQST